MRVLCSVSIKWCLNFHFVLIIVLLVEFTSTNFSGSESSGEVLVTLALSGISTNNIDVLINLNEMSATGY